MLGIVQRVIAGWLADQKGGDRADAQYGEVTLIQRFGSALNLSVHFHMLWLDGVYEDTTEQPQRKLRLRRRRLDSTQGGGVPSQCPSGTTLGWAGSPR